MRWMRGGDDDSASTAAMSAGLAAIDEIFRPNKHKQTEFIQESRRRKVDIAASGDIDFERGVAVIRASGPAPVADAAADQDTLPPGDGEPAVYVFDETP